MQIGHRVSTDVRRSTVHKLSKSVKCCLVLIKLLMVCQSTVLINTWTRTPLVHMISVLSFSEILHHFSCKSKFPNLDGYIAWYMTVCKLKCWCIWFYSAPNNQRWASMTLMENCLWKYCGQSWTHGDRVDNKTNKIIIDLMESLKGRIPNHCKSLIASTNLSFWGPPISESSLQRSNLYVFQGYLWITQILGAS